VPVALPLLPILWAVHGSLAKRVLRINPPLELSSPAGPVFVESRQAALAARRAGIS